MKKNRRRATQMLAALALGLIAALAMGCGRAVNRTAERRIREALPALIGPAREYRVHVENAPLRTIQGKLSNVAIDGDDVQYPGGMLLDSLHIDLRDVEVDANRGRVRRIGQADLTITISERSLDEYLAGEAPAGESIRKLRIRLLDSNSVTLTGERVTLFNVGVPFRLTGPVRAATATRIQIDPRRLDVVGLPIGGPILRFFNDRIESAVDLSRMQVPVKLTGVTTSRGQMVLTGSIDAEALLAETQSAR